MRLDAALSSVGHALAEAVEMEPSLSLQILGRNDGLFACFPGGDGSPGYGAHLDGNSETVRISMIAYVNAGWSTVCWPPPCWNRAHTWLTLLSTLPTILLTAT